MPRACILAAVLITAIASTHAPAAAARPDRDDAETWYTQAIDRYDAARAVVSPEEDRHLRHAIERYLRRPAGPPPPEIRAMLERMRPVLRLVRRAAGADRCELVVRDDIDPDGRLPQLPHLDALADVVALEGMALLHAGNPAAAAERLADLYRMAEHAASADLVVGTVFAFDIAAQADRLVRWAIDDGRFGPAESEIILSAVRRIDGRNPFRFLEAVASERTERMGWYRERYEGDGGVDLARREMAGMAPDLVARAAFAVMTAAELDADLDGAEHLVERVVDTMRIPDVERARHELQRLDEANRRGDHGAVARTVLTSFSALHDRMSAASESIAERRRHLDLLAGGHIQRDELANAAIGYARAIDAYAVIDAERRERVRRFAAHPTSIVDEVVEGVLDETDAVIALARKAAALERCDFWAERAPYPVGAAAYHVGLRELADLVHADALRHAGTGRYDTAVDRFALSFRMASHLATDHVLASSLLAQHVFERTRQAIEPALREALFTEAHRMTLVRAARGVGSRDPFGYAAASAAQREGLARWLTRSLGPMPVELALRTETTIERCDDDQLLFLALCAERIETARAAERAGNASPDAETAEDGPVRRLAAALSTGDLDRAVKWTDLARAAIEDQRFDAFDRHSAPRLVRVGEHRAAAAAAVREALVSLGGTVTAATAE